ncbi:hypothetical protein APY03_1740 [Variovorax sp. WDL1]|nr:hypothetical protein APY03_1740 [Variovorax sp. WDL1]
MQRFDPEHAGSLVGPLSQPGHRRSKKKPGAKTPGWEALLLSHIKAPAQGGKAGSGKPPTAEFSKGITCDQASSNLLPIFRSCSSLKVLRN